MNDTCICENTPTVWRLTGVTRTLRLRIFNPDGTPLDLTGRTVAVTIARDNSEFSYAPGFVIEGDDGNVVKFEWPAAKQGAGDYTINVTTTDGSGNVDRVNWHGPTGIRLVDFSFMVRGEDALGVTSEANIGLDGTFTMNGTGMSAYDEWLAEGHTGTPEDFIAWLRQPAVDAASAAEAQMGQIQERADADHTRAGNDHTTAGQDHTRAGNDHTTATDDHRIAAADHSTATDDHTLAASDHVTAAEDHRVAGIDHGTAADDHTRAGQDHTQAGSDHTRAGEDHNRAGDDHQTASSDHTRAGEDHTTAGSDHTRAGEDHTQAGNDHTRAEADHGIAADDHTQATADHAVMAGYDTRLGNVEDEVSQLGQKVQDLDTVLFGGKKYYANQEFDVQNTWVNYTNVSAQLSEIIDFPFKFKFSTPEGVNITSFGIRFYEEDGVTYHNYPSSINANEEGTMTRPRGTTWKVSKVAIASVTPDVRYTGTFKIEVYIDAESVLDAKIDKTSIVQTTGADTDKIMSQKAVTDVVTPIAEDVHNLDQAVNGGEVVYADGTFTANNTWINYTMNEVVLSEPILFPFKFKFSTPEGVNITSFGIRFYEEDGVTYHHYPASGLPNEDLEVTIPGGGNYKVSKISINQVTPDVRYTGEFGIKVWKEQDATLATKAELQAVADAVDFDERETIPDYYFANDYLDGKVTFIRNLLEGCMANGDAFFFQTDEHWEMNAQHSPALVKYIADRLNISRLFDGGDTTHNIDANGFHHTNPAAIDFNSLRAKTYKGNIFHTIGNHEYLTWAYTNIAQYSGVDFGNWHDFLYYQQPDRIVYGDSDKHYYYVNNYQKKIRYIFLSSYKKRETPIESGGKYYTVAEYDYSTEQLSWFTGTALNVEAGWTIIVFSHNFISYNHGERDGEGYIANVSPFVPDASKPFAQAILQYNGAGTIAAVFAGHWHSDAVLTVNDALAGLSDNPTGKTFPCIVTTCDAYNFNGLGEEERLYNRTVDTITEQAFDVVVLDKTARKFTLVRIGGPAYNILVQAPNGKYPLFGDLEYREVIY